jgi:hypothetical protein
MLRTKTRRFTEEEIAAKFKKPVSKAERKSASVPLTVEDERRGVADKTLAAATAREEGEGEGECRSRK